MKLGGAATVRAITVLITRLLEVPVMVTLNDPVAALLLAVSVKVLVPEVLAGLKEAVTPLGRFEAVRATLLLKPFCGETEIVLVPLLP